MSSNKFSFSQWKVDFVDCNLSFSLCSLRLCGELDFFQESHWYVLMFLLGILLVFQSGLGEHIIDYFTPIPTLTPTMALALKVPQTIGDIHIAYGRSDEGDEFNVQVLDIEPGTQAIVRIQDAKRILAVTTVTADATGTIYADLGPLRETLTLLQVDIVVIVGDTQVQRAYPLPNDIARAMTPTPTPTYTSTVMATATPTPTPTYTPSPTLTPTPMVATGAVPYPNVYREPNRNELMGILTKDAKVFVCAKAGGYYLIALDQCHLANPYGWVLATHLHLLFSEGGFPEALITPMPTETVSQNE